jgi:hypothetical protein
MAQKLLQVLTNKPNASTVTLLNAEPSTTGYELMALDLGNATYEKTYSGQRGTQGGVLAGAEAQNRLSSWTLAVTGSSKDDLHAKLSVLWSLEEELRRFGGTVTWRAEGATYRMKMRVLDSGIAIAGFDRLWEFNQRLTVTLGVVTPPYMEGESLDIFDDFSTDTETNYTFDTGSGSDVAVTGGALTVTANPTTEKRLIHTDRGYDYGDVQVTIKATPGSTITSFLAGVVLKRVDALNYLRVYVDDNGANSRLRIDKVVAGATTNLATTNLGARVVNGVAFWVRGRIEGANVFAEFFAAAPSPMVAPTTTNNYTLATGAEQTAFGPTVAGKTGIVWLPQQSAAMIDDFDVDPYTYRNVTTVDPVAPAGLIPGDAPALFEAFVTPSGGAASPIWGMLGWWQRTGAFNQCWNGDFENSYISTSNWSVASVTNLNSGAATSIARITSAGKYGVASGQVVAPASVDRGASFRIFRRFKKGITYTAEAWIHSAAGVTNTYIRLGNAAANDKATSGNTALSTTWQRITITWVPLVDYDDAHVAVNIAAATGTTFEIDGVMVYEGTTAPTSTNQSEGRGGFPPLGVLEAENGVISAGTLTSDASSRSGFLVVGVPTGVSVLHLVDPALLTPDDYTQNEIAVEVWGRVRLTTTPVTAIVSALPVTATTTLPAVYSEEWGSVGKLLTSPSSGTVFRLVRLGTLRLPTDAGRVFLQVIWSANDTTAGLDYLMLVPSNWRALSPSGRANDANFPAFAPTTSEITRRIRSDLSGRLKEPAAGTAEVLAPGLGGSLLEMLPGNNDLICKLSSMVPDDPTLGTTTEQLAHSATLHLAVTPRWRLGR